MPESFTLDEIANLTPEQMQVARSGSSLDFSMDEIAQDTMGVKMARAMAQAKSRNWGEYARSKLPFFGTAENALEGLSVLDSIKRLKSGGAADRDYRTVAKYMKKLQDQQDWGALQQVGDMVASIPGFAIEFATTAGAFKGGEEATQQVGERLLGRALQNQTVKQFAKTAGGKAAIKATGAAVPFLAGAAVQTAANPQQIAQKIVGRMMPGLKLDKNEKNRVTLMIQEPDEPFIESIGKGTFDAALEIGTEYGGEIMGPAFRKIADKIPYVKGLKAAVIKRFLSTPGNTFEKLGEAFHRAGWHGVIPEVGEERLYDVLAGASGVQQNYGATGQVMTGDPGGWKQIAMEAVAFSVPGAIHAATSMEGISRKQAEKLGAPEEIVKAGRPTRNKWYREEYLPALEAQYVGKTAAEVPAGSEPGVVVEAQDANAPKQLEQGAGPLSYPEDQTQPILPTATGEATAAQPQPTGQQGQFAEGPVAAPQPQATSVSPEVQSAQQGPPPSFAEAIPDMPGKTGILNQVADEIQISLGMEPVAKLEGMGDKEADAAAADKMAKDPTWIPGLIEELGKKPRPHTDLEAAGMARYQRALVNRRVGIAGDMTQARTVGDIERLAQLQTEGVTTDRQIQALHEATKRSGSEAGRGFRARQIRREEDFSLTRLLTEKIISKGGEQLTPEEVDKIKEQADQIKELQGQVAEYQAKEKQTAIDEGLKAAEQRAKQSSTKTRKRTSRAVTEEAKTELSAAIAEFKKVQSEWAKGLTAGANPVPVDLIGAAAKVVRAAVKYHYNNFLDFWADFKGSMNSDRDTFEAAWQQVKAEGAIPPQEVDANDPKAVAKWADELHTAAWKAGAKTRDEAINMVHSEMEQVLPDWTRSDAMEAMSRYGDYEPYTKDELKIRKAQTNGEIRNLLKLRDMAEKNAPKASGKARHPRSDAERQFEKLVNEAKKEGGYDNPDPEKALKSTLASMETFVENRIKDVKAEIQRGELLIKKKGPSPTSEKLTRLRNELAGWLEIRKKMFPKPGATIQQRLAAAEKQAGRAINEMEASLSENVTTEKKPRSSLWSPELGKRRARLADLRMLKALRDEMAGLTDPKLSDDERALRSYERSLRTRLADYEKRLANKDFAPKKREEKTYPKEILDLQDKLEAIKEEIRKGWKEQQWQQMHPARKGAVILATGTHASRSILAGFDISGFGRQGGVVVASHPILAAKTLGPTLASVKRQGYRRARITLEGRKYFAQAVRDGLDITDVDAPMTQQEESFIGDLDVLRRLPGFRSKWSPGKAVLEGIEASDRIYTAGLNQMRYDLYESLTDTLSWMGRWWRGAPTEAESKLIANYVNLATGRGWLPGRLKSVTASAATVFFSPRYVASRFQLLVGQPLWGGPWKGTARARVLIAGEYARTVIGMGLFYGLIQLIRGLWPKDDERNRPHVEWDWRSSDFGKIRMGDTRLDPLFGFSQSIVLVGRTIKGQTKRSSGQIVDIRGENIPYAGSNWMDIATRFARSKLAPVPSNIVDVLAGENVVFEKTTPASVAKNMVVPLSLRDVLKAIEDQGISKGAAISILGIFGMGTQVYKADYRKQLGSSRSHRPSRPHRPNH